MENASKALLIVAGVLVVILIITFGIKIFSSSSESGKTASEMGKIISEKMGEAADMVSLATNGKISFSEGNLKKQTEQAYQQYIKENNPNISATDFIKNRLNSVYGAEIVTNVSEPENDIFKINVNLNGENKEYNYNYKTGSILKVEKKIITFKIDDKTYQAEEGMNWIEWCNSKYSNNEFTFYTSKWYGSGIYLEDKYYSNIDICKKSNSCRIYKTVYCDAIKANVYCIVTNQSDPAKSVKKLEYAKQYKTSIISNNVSYKTKEVYFSNEAAIIFEN